MIDEIVMFDLVQRFASTMIRTFEMNDMLYELSDTATTMLDASGAGVSVMTDNRLLFVAATSEGVVTMEHAQEAHQAGPCVESYRTGDVMTVSTISDLDRWPDYQQAAARVGFASVAALPLAIDELRIGSLSVYDVREREWSDHDIRAAHVLADMATTYIMRAGELAEAQQLSEHLQIALESRIVIEQAKGMLASEHDVSVDRAFELLRGLARDRRTPLRSVANAVVTLGLRIPPPAPEPVR